MSSKIKIKDITLKNRFILAPMAGITDMPFRLIAKKYGASVVNTEMISAKGLCYKQKKTYEYLRHCPEEKPISVQIFGSDPKIMADAAQIAIEAGADMLDINMGCPVKKVVKTGAGAALLKDIRKAEQIIKAVRDVCNIPLTIKIRSGWSHEYPTAIEIARMAESCGIDAITIHPRFASQGFSSISDWSTIAQVKEKISIPVIGNGDIFSATDAINMIKKTGCDAIMIARGAIGNPWIFKHIIALEREENILPLHWDEKRKIIMEHCILAERFINENRLLYYLKKISLWYIKGLSFSSLFRERAVRAKNKNEILALLNKYFIMLEERGESKGC